MAAPTFAVSFTDLGVTLGGPDLPPVSGTAAGELSVPPRALLAGRAAVQAPIWARAIDVALQSGAARFKAEGEISVDAEGIVDGAITLRIAGLEALPAFIAALPERVQQRGFGLVGAIFALGPPTTLDGEPASELTVEITRSAVTIGSMEILTLPPVPL